MNNGYVKLWRKSLDAGWLKNPKLWAFWCWCLLKASHKEHETIVNLNKIRLQPGQFIFTYRTASKETGLTIRETRTILEFLKREGNMTHQTTHAYSVITITNWHIYQADKSESDTQNDKRATSHRHIYNNVKNEKINMSDSDFSLFYKAYPKHEGKQKAFDTWVKIKPDNILLNTILTAIKNQKAHKEALKANGEFCPAWPLPATWLNGRRYEDEIPDQDQESERPWFKPLEGALNG